MFCATCRIYLLLSWVKRLFYLKWSVSFHFTILTFKFSVSFTAVMVFYAWVIRNLCHLIAFQFHLKILVLQLFHSLSVSFRVPAPSFIWEFIVLDLLLLSVVSGWSCLITLLVMIQIELWIPDSETFHIRLFFIFTAMHSNFPYLLTFLIFNKSYRKAKNSSGF